MFKRVTIKFLVLAVWAFSSVCLAAFSGGMGAAYAMSADQGGMSEMGAMNIEQEGMGCDTVKNMGASLQCCVNRDQTQNGAANFVQVQPLLIGAPMVKPPTYNESEGRLFKHSFRVLNTSSPPKNLPGIIVKKE